MNKNIFPLYIKTPDEGQMSIRMTEEEGYDDRIISALSSLQTIQMKWLPLALRIVVSDQNECHGRVKIESPKPTGYRVSLDSVSDLRSKMSRESQFFKNFEYKIDQFSKNKNRKIVFILGFRTLRIFLDQEHNLGYFERGERGGGDLRVVNWDRAKKKSR